MRNHKTGLTVILILCILCTLSVPVFAAKTVKYETYMCIGDSVASGCAQPKDGIENKFEYTGDDFAGYLASLMTPDSTIIYRGYNGEAVPTAYHSIVADRLGAKLLQCGRSAMRAVELRYMLTGDYNEPDTTYYWGNLYYTDTNSGFTTADLDKVNEIFHFADKAKEADIISIGLGGNDVISPTMSAVLTKLYTDTTDPKIKETIEKYEASGDLGVAFAKVIEAFEKMGKVREIIDTALEAFYENLESFKENYEAILNTIIESNPDVTIICVGSFNPFNNTKLSADSMAKLNGVILPIVNSLNEYIRSMQTKYRGTCYYADVTDTELYDMNVSDERFYDLLTLKLHPTTAGHEYMAKNILAAIPGYKNEKIGIVNRLSNMFRGVSSWSTLLNILRSFKNIFSRLSIR